MINVCTQVKEFKNKMTLCCTEAIFRHIKVAVVVVVVEKEDEEEDDDNGDDDDEEQQQQ